MTQVIRVAIADGDLLGFDCRGYSHVRDRQTP